jgi:chemotaxis response regulator CheB
MDTLSPLILLHENGYKALPMPVRILIVEDSDVLRRSVCSMVQGCADFYVVGEACDGVQAINQSKALQPDVILLDMSMPNLSGLSPHHS